MLSQLWQELWTGLFVVLVAAGILTGQNVLIAFGAMGLLMTGVSWLWGRVSLSRVTYERILPRRRVFIGETVPLSIVLTNSKPVPLGWVRVEDSIPDALTVEGARVTPSVDPNSSTLEHRTSMGWYERVRWDYSVRFDRRGYHRLGPARIDSGDIFGLFDSRARASDTDAVLVYPKVLPLAELGIRTGRPLGDVTGGLRALEDPSRPAGVRRYQAGDPLSAIDWKATARGRSLFVRTHDPSISMTVMLAVSVETSPQQWRGYSSARLERAITAAASLAAHLAEAGYSVGLTANGIPMVSESPSELPPSRSHTQVLAALEMLATMGSMVRTPMAAHLEERVTALPTGAAVVVVAAYCDRDLGAVLSRARAKGHPATLAYVGDGPVPEMPPGVEVIDIGGHLSAPADDRAAGGSG